VKRRCYRFPMIKTTNAALFFLAAGILTSVTVLSVYQILFAFPLIYFTYQAFKNNEYQLPKSGYWLFAFFLVALLSLVINFDIIPKPSKNFGRLKYFLFGIAGIYVFRVWLNEATLKTKTILANTFLVSIIAAALFACYQFWFKGDLRPKGFTDTMRYGYGSGMLLLTLLSALIHQRRLPWLNWGFALAAFIMGFIGMYLTFTRGAFLGFLSGLPFVLYYYRPKIAYGVAVLAIVIGSVLGYFYFFGNQDQGEGSRYLMSKENSGDVIRRSQWKAAMIATQERPLLGYGFSNFHSQLKRIKNDYDLDAKEYDDAHSHNLFLEIASGTGLIGLFIFLGWVISWAWESFRSDKIKASMVIPFGVAWVVSSQFEVTFDANNASMIFFFYAISSAIRIPSSSSQVHPR